MFKEINKLNASIEMFIQEEKKMYSMRVICS